MKKQQNEKIECEKGRKKNLKSRRANFKESTNFRETLWITGHKDLNSWLKIKVTEEIFENNTLNVKGN